MLTREKSKLRLTGARELVLAGAASHVILILDLPVCCKLPLSMETIVPVLTLLENILSLTNVIKLVLCQWASGLSTLQPIRIRPGNEICLEHRYAYGFHCGLRTDQPQSARSPGPSTHYALLIT